jgi:hypothetical protein
MLSFLGVRTGRPQPAPVETVVVALRELLPNLGARTVGAWLHWAGRFAGLRSELLDCADHFVDQERLGNELPHAHRVHRAG